MTLRAFAGGRTRPPTETDEFGEVAEEREVSVGRTRRQEAGRCRNDGPLDAPATQGVATVVVPRIIRLRDKACAFEALQAGKRHMPDCGENKLL